VLALEGGYDLPAICDCSEECVRALLGEPVTPIAEEELSRPPCAPAIDTLLRTIAVQTPHWPVVKKYMSLVTCSALEASTCSASKLDGKLIMVRDRVESETVSAMASLSMQQAVAGANSIGGNTSTSKSGPSNDSISGNSRATARRRSSDMNVNDDGNNSNEEPMDQDEPSK